MSLPIFQDDIFTGERKYKMVDNLDGTYSFQDVTPYDQVGTEINAAIMNEIASNKGAGGSIFEITFPDEYDTKEMTLSVDGVVYTTTIEDNVAFIDGVKEVGTTVITCENLTQTLEIECFSHYKLEAQKYNYKKYCVAGGVAFTNYTSLSDVFNDEVATRRLMTIHNSVDYLLEWYNDDNDILDTIIASNNAMKWLGLRDYACDKFMARNDVKTALLASDNWEYILKDHVPVMTSNTAPYGEVSATSYYNNYYPYYVFYDGIVAGHAWIISSSMSTASLTYKFTNPINVKKVKISNSLTDGGENQNVKTFKISCSNDNTDWIDYTKVFTNTVEDEFFDIDGSSYYLYWKITIVDSYGTNSSKRIAALQFYGRSLNVSVPTMTSNTEPWGEAISTTTFSGRDSYCAFNASAPGEQLKVWMSNITGKDSYIGYKFNSNICVKGVFYIDDCGRKDFTIMYNVTIQGSNNGTVWEDVETYTNTNYSAYFKNIHYLTNSNSYKYWRMKANSLNNQGTEYLTEGNAMVPTLNFYGVDYSEREFEEGSTIKYIYDHGIELETITDLLSGGTATYEHQEGKLYAKTNGNSYFGFMVGVDITNYNLCRVITDDIYKMDNVSYPYCFYLFPDTSTMINTGQRLGIAALNCDTPYTNSYDVSNVNQSVGLAIGYTTSSSDGAEYSFNEWWLE